MLFLLQLLHDLEQVKLHSLSLSLSDLSKDYTNQRIQKSRGDYDQTAVQIVKEGSRKTLQEKALELVKGCN